MSHFAMELKTELWNMISEIGKYPWLFAQNPQSNFSRNRDFTFEDTMKFLITSGSGTVNQELLHYFDYDPRTITQSAFNQQRSHLLHEGLEFLFHEFTNNHLGDATFKGYRILACDGSKVVYATNPNNVDDYVKPNKPGDRGYNHLHLNALYDVCNHVYLDALIQPGVKSDERDALYTFMNRLSCKKDFDTIITADRGYESYNTIAVASANNLRFAFRAKDIHSKNSLLSSYKKEYPDTEEFDVRIKRFITRRRGKTIESQPNIYKRIHPLKRFDYLAPDSDSLYYLEFRVVRFKITENTYECLITNLPEWEFPIEDLKELYNLRWKLELAFRDLKYSVGMMNFHAKKVEYIKQEIFAKLILFNFCAIVTSHTAMDKANSTEQKRKSKKEDKKYTYKLNYKMAINICHNFLRSATMASSTVLMLIKRYLVPEKQKRSFPRNLRGIGAVDFIYRIA